MINRDKLLFSIYNDDLSLNAHVDVLTCVCAKQDFAQFVLDIVLDGS